MVVEVVELPVAVEQRTEAARAIQRTTRSPREEASDRDAAIAGSITTRIRGASSHSSERTPSFSRVE